MKLVKTYTAVFSILLTTAFAQAISINNIIVRNNINDVVLGRITYNVSAAGVFSGQKLSITVDSVDMYSVNDCSTIPDGNLPIGGPWVTNITLTPTTGIIGSTGISGKGLAAVANSLFLTPGNEHCALLHYSYHAMNGGTDEGIITVDHPNIKCQSLSYDSGLGEYTGSCTLDHSTVNFSALTP